MPAITAGRSVLVSLSLCTLSFTACGKGPSAGQAAAGGGQSTVQESFEVLRGLARSHSYVDLRQYIEPGGSETVIDLLMAIDELEAAEAGARQQIQRCCTGTDPAMFDAPDFSHLLPFAAPGLVVQRVSETGDSACVEVASGGTCRRVEFVRQGRRWLYVPPAFPRDLPVAIRRLAGTIDRLSVALTATPKTPTQLAQHCRIFIEPKARHAIELAGLPAAATAERSVRP